MTGKDKRSDTFEKLRGRAEHIIEQRAKTDARMDSDELTRLLHEIEVYQVEVELQNEELRNTARELRESRDEYIDLFNFAPVAFVVLDSKGRIKQANAAAADILGDDPAWLKGRLLSERIYSPDRREYFTWFKRMAENGETASSPDLRLLGKGRNIFHVRFDARAIWGKASRLREWRIAMTDITDRRRAEEKLRSLNEKLERRVAERTATAEARASQLRQLAIKLSKVENRERQRIAGILHDDLQQYLAAIRFRVQMSGIGREENPGDFELLQLIDESIQRCRSLSYDLSPPVLNQNGFLAALHWQAEDMRKKLGFNVQIEAETEAEPDSMELAYILFGSVKELLFNAVKHSQVNSATVQARKRDDRIRVRVKDEGKGCDPLTIRPSDGELLGFGLFSIQERIEFAGGQFEIESAPGKGFQVTMEVPQNDVQISEPPDRMQSEVISEEIESGALNEKKRIKIIIADDHDVMRQGLANLLESEDDLEVVAQASDGGEAVRLTRELNPDVVLMDVSMPGMSGTKATARIKKCRRHIRIIGLSMHDDPDTKRKMIQAGATAYLYKASPAQKLLDTIRKSIS